MRLLLSQTQFEVKTAIMGLLRNGFFLKTDIFWVVFKWFNDGNSFIGGRFKGLFFLIDFSDFWTHVFCNSPKLAAITISEIYKARWQIELFFKWIKQNLKIKTFLGTSKNAVLSQIWVAMIYTLLLAYIKFQTSFSGSILNLSRIIQESLFFRQHLIDLLGLNSPDPPEKQDVFQLSFCWLFLPDTSV